MLDSVFARSWAHCTPGHGRGRSPSRQPVTQDSQLLAVQAVIHMETTSLRGNQTSPAQDLKMMRKGGLRYLVAGRELPSAESPSVCQQSDHIKADCVGQGAPQLDKLHIRVNGRGNLAGCCARGAASSGCTMPVRDGPRRLPFHGLPPCLVAPDHHDCGGITDCRASLSCSIVSCLPAKRPDG